MRTSDFILSVRGGPEDRGVTPGQVLARAVRGRDEDTLSPEEAAEENALRCLAAGYAPGQISQLAQSLADVTADLQAERELIERGRRHAAHVSRMHAAGQITAWQVPGMLGDDLGDEGRAAKLEWKRDRLARQLGAAQQTVSVARQARPEDPLESASRHAHEIFAELTRQRMAEAQASRPEPRPFGAASRGAAGTEHALEASRAAAQAYAAGPGADQCAGPGCPVCAYGRQRDASSEGARYVRVYPLEDTRIISRAQGGDGRTVEAYAAVFGEQAEIRDQMGHYYETIDPHAWDDRLAEAQRARGGVAAEIKCIFNHGMTRQGTPSDRWSLTIGRPLEIRPDSRGLLTITRYSDDEVLAKIKNGEITSQSFVGACLRSSPEQRPGRRYGQDGTVPVVRRLQLGLREYGPVLWPAYTGAEILGVRMERSR
jgi:phage head maturation protease